jgi:hypothetical protein
MKLDLVAAIKWLKNRKRCRYCKGKGYVKRWYQYESKFNYIRCPECGGKVKHG